MERGPGMAHDKAGSKDFGDINALTVLPGAVCGRFILTLSAPAAGTVAPCLPGTLLAGFFPAEVWRNSSKV